MAQVVVALAVLLILMRAVVFFMRLEPVVVGLIDMPLAVEVLEGALMHLALRELQMLLLEVDQVVAGVAPTMMETPPAKAATVVYLVVEAEVVVLEPPNLPVAVAVVLAV
jgi:hypothetical protein